MEKKTKIGILGAGVEGIEAAEYLKRHGFQNVTVFDQKDGPDYLEKAGECEVVFRSPGIHIKKLASLREKGVQISSTTQYFMEHCPCRVIGITGTKGKGTTSTLIYLMLKEAGYDAYLGGNIGQSPFTFLDDLKAGSIVVLEMSSFQLQDMTVSPHIAVVLRVSSDHMDYHVDRDEYLEAKSAIVRFQKEKDVVVLNKDYDSSEYYSALTKAKKLWVSIQGKVDAAAYLEDGKIVVKRKETEMIGDVKKVALIGKHHLENVLPAVTVARLLDVPIPAIQNVLSSFAGLAHRLEFVSEIKGVKFYNDSFSTTPETSIAATYAFEKPVLLIAGGSEKNLDYTEWGQELQRNNFLKMVILIGQTAPRMEEALKKAGDRVKIAQAANLKEAIQKASQNATAGDVVVMSPATASFDQFKNYKERGEKFREFVKQ